MGCVGKAGLALAVISVLARCSSAAKDTNAGTSAGTATNAAVEPGRCDSQAAQFAVGQQASGALLEQAKARSGSMMARILGPHDSVTMDYRSERLNLNADDTGKIIRATCG